MSWVCELRSINLKCSETDARRLSVLSFVESIGIFLDFFVGSVNCSSLIYNLYILFWTFSDMSTVIRLEGIYFIEALTSTFRHFFSHFLLFSEFYEPNIYKLSNIFETCPEA